MNRIIAPFKPPRQEQHERVFIQDATNRYKARLLTAAGYIYSILRIYRQQGHKFNIPNPRSFYTHFGIPKSTFYRALIQLEKAEGIKFQWEPVGGISMWWGTEPQVEPQVEPQRWNQIPLSDRGDFEAFVRSQWRKLKNQEIRSFHRFVEKSTDFKAWWEKFRSQPISNPQFPIPNSEPVTPIVFEPPINSERISADRFRQLRQLIQSKK